VKQIKKWDLPDIGEEEIRAVTEAIRNGYIKGSGSLVKEFENRFARKLRVKYALATSNGTTALLCALQAWRYRLNKLKIGVPTLTFIATANTADEIGKRIRLLDCDSKTWNITRKKIPDGINLLMPVDVGGLSCDYDDLRRKGIHMIADSAESCGGKYKGKYIGSQAEIHTFSFHRAKIITTGEGGMVTTNRRDLYDLMKKLINHGYSNFKTPWEYRHNFKAFNYRMMDLQAAIGIEQLKKLDRYVMERREKARIYKDILGNLVEYQEEPRNCYHPYFFFGILVKNGKNLFCKEMLGKGIETKTWTPVHRQLIYADLDTGFPIADGISSRLVLLPIGNKLGPEDIKEIGETARKLLR